MAENEKNQASRQSLKALLSLIDEPDPNIYMKIADSVLAFGAIAIPLLKEELENTFDPTLRKRLRNLVQQIRFKGIMSAFQRWYAAESHDLIQFLKIVARFHNPEIKHVELERRLLALKKDIWLELSQNLTSLESIGLVNHILFNVRKFKPATAGTSKAENLFLDQFLANKTIHPMMLGAFYLGICQRLTLPVYFVDLPDNFLVAFTKLPVGGKESRNIEPLFYINPLMEGVAFEKSQIEEFLELNNIKPEPQFFTPHENLAVAIKLLRIVQQYYKTRNDELMSGNIDAIIATLAL